MARYVYGWQIKIQFRTHKSYSRFMVFLQCEFRWFVFLLLLFFFYTIVFDCCFFFSSTTICLNRLFIIRSVLLGGSIPLNSITENNNYISNCEKWKILGEGKSDKHCDINVFFLRVAKRVTAWFLSFFLLWFFSFVVVRFGHTNRT